MKALIKSESSIDTSRVFQVLMAQNITVIKTREPFGDFGLLITIKVTDQNELNQLLLKLNQTSFCGVRLIKIYRDSWLDKLFKKR